MGTVNASQAQLPYAAAATAPPATAGAPVAASAAAAAAPTPASTTTGFTSATVDTLTAAGIPAAAIAAASTALAHAQAGGVNTAGGAGTDPAAAGMPSQGTGQAPAQPGTGTGGLPGIPSAPGGTAPQAPQGQVPPSGQMDPTYSSLVGRQVYVLQALGFPPGNLQALNAAHPSALDVAKNIMAWVQQPALVDTYLHLPAGTTAQKLAALPQDVLAEAAGAGQAQQQQGAQQPQVAKDTTYPMLDAEVVQLFRAMKTPEDRIAQINSGNPSQQQVLDYIKSAILQDPEAWDVSCNNPKGTARAALVQFGLQPAPEGQGHPTLPSSNTGIPQVGNIPGVNTSTPVSGPATATDGTNGMIKNIVWGAAALGVAFLGYKFLKNRNAAKELQAAGGVASAVEGTQTLGQTRKWWQAGAKASKSLGMARGSGGSDVAALLAARAERPAIEIGRFTENGVALVPDAQLAFGWSAQKAFDNFLEAEKVRRMGDLNALQTLLASAVRK